MNRLVDGDKLRLHFNRHGAAPLVWCVTILDKAGAPLLEIAVKGFRVYGVAIESVYCPKMVPDDEDGIPSAWLAPVQHAAVSMYINDAGWAEIFKGEV